MKYRSPIAVALLPFITFGIYGLVWEVKTKNEMNRLGSSIPTAWLIIIPLINLWWLWKYCEGVERVSGGKLSAVLAFVLLFLLGFIGAAIIQNEFNKVGDQAVAATAEAPVQQPAPGFGAPDPSFTPKSTALVKPADQNNTPEA